MQDQALQNIFDEGSTNTRYVEITKKLSLTRYETVDVYGRKWLADSNTRYNVGDYVVVQFQRIVGTSSPFTTPVNYEV